MPIVVKDATWTETETHVHLEVPLKGRPKPDLFLSDVYLKVRA